MNELPLNGTDVLDRLRELPGGSELLEVAARWGEVELIGGAVRDILLDRQAAPREFDVVVADNANGFADALAKKLGVLSGQNPEERFESRLHDRFRTAIVSNNRVRIDIATRRRETYARPGALPNVELGTPDQDLDRRDFTVNAIAVRIGVGRSGTLRSASGALEDLATKRLRVLHDGSFIDDPTRLLRLARYAARLAFEVEDHTAVLAREATSVGALETVSGARIGAELRLALAEPDPVAALESLAQLSVLTALHQSLTFHAAVARAALDMLPPPPYAWPDVLLLAALLLPAHTYDTTDYETRLRVLLDGWEFPAVERERTVHSTILAPRLAERLKRAQKPSEIYDMAHNEPLEAIALAAALAEADADGSADAADAARWWLAELRLVELEITGDDLLTAGIPEGPEIGQRLEAVLRLRLDGELPHGREAELRAALEGEYERG
jgi:tRNA nucleotidyltransferase (CCA-adding enzyme)